MDDGSASETPFEVRRECKKKSKRKKRKKVKKVYQGHHHRRRDNDIRVNDYVWSHLKAALTRSHREEGKCPRGGDRRSRCTQRCRQRIAGIQQKRRTSRALGETQLIEKKKMKDESCLLQMKTKRASHSIPWLVSATITKKKHTSLNCKIVKEPSSHKR